MTRTWNYRIVDFGTHKALHEVHYEDAKPVSYSSNPATFACDPDQDDIASGLERAIQSVREYPILPVSEFGQ